METHFHIREATRDDLERICSLLVAAKLSTHAILVSGTRYWVAESADREVVGTVGLELGNNAVLLRSACVSVFRRGQGIGDTLIQYALDLAANSHYASAYLFSTGAKAYWARWGFCEVPVSEVITVLPDVPQVRQYQELGCLSTEVAWRRNLTKISVSERS